MIDFEPLYPLRSYKKKNYPIYSCDKVRVMSEISFTPVITHVNNLSNFKEIFKSVPLNITIGNIQGPFLYTRNYENITPLSTLHVPITEPLYIALYEEVTNNSRVLMGFRLYKIYVAFKFDISKLEISDSNTSIFNSP